MGSFVTLVGVSGCVVCKCYDGVDKWLLCLCVETLLLLFVERKLGGVQELVLILL